MIEFVDLKSEFAELRDPVLKSLQRVLERQWSVLGEEVSNFEQEFSSYLGSTYAVGVNSGSDVLLFAVKSLGIGAGGFDER